MASLSNYDWLTYEQSYTSGSSGNGKVVFTTSEENTGRNTRSASVKITPTNGTAQTVTIKLSGLNIVKRDGNPMPFTFDSGENNNDAKAFVTNASKLHLYIIDPLGTNTSGISITDCDLIPVSNSSNEIGYSSLKTSTVLTDTSFSNLEYTDSSFVEPNLSDYVNVTSDLTTISSDIGSSESYYVNVVVKVEENTLVRERIWYIVLGTELGAAYVQVVLDAADVTLTVNTTAPDTLAATSGGSTTINVTSNTTWSVS